MSPPGAGLKVSVVQADMVNYDDVIVENQLSKLGLYIIVDDIFLGRCRKQGHNNVNRRINKIAMFNPE